MPTYMYDYNYKGNRYSIDIFAESREDADDIIKAMPLAKYEGELYTRIYVPRFLPFKWIANMIINIKNWSKKC